MTCKARQYSDQMRCLACRLVWDVNDTEPPPPCGQATAKPPKDKKWTKADWKRNKAEGTITPSMWQKLLDSINGKVDTKTPNGK